MNKYDGQWRGVMEYTENTWAVTLEIGGEPRTMTGSIVVTSPAGVAVYQIDGEHVAASDHGWQSKMFGTGVWEFHGRLIGTDSMEVAVMPRTSTAGVSWRLERA